jgi:hypothetical protein
MAEKRIFISYRRSDTAGYAGRLYDTLKNYFGEDRLFFDVDTIKPGVDFEQKIKSELDRSAVVLVLIGEHWLGARDMSGARRLDNPHDYVRLEVGTALSKNMAVIPVLLQGAPVPSGNELPEPLSELSRRNAVRLSDENWSSDLSLLASVLKNTLGVPGSLKEQRIKRFRQIVFGLSLLAAVLSITNNFILQGSLPLLRFIYLIILSANIVFITYLLVTMKRDLDRLGWTITSTAVIPLMFVALGDMLSALTPIPLLIVAWLVNFVKSDE